MKTTKIILLLVICLLLVPPIYSYVANWQEWAGMKEKEQEAQTAVNQQKEAVQIIDAHQRKNFARWWEMNTRYWKNRDKGLESEILTALEYLNKLEVEFKSASDKLKEKEAELKSIEQTRKRLSPFRLFN